MPTSDQPRSPEQLAELGSDVFQHSVRPHLRPEDDGKFVAIDLRTGSYELDDDDYTAVMRLRGRLPDAQIWLERAGHPTACKIRLA